MIGYVDTLDFDQVWEKIYDFFKNKKGFRNCHGQSRFSIMAACEDPSTITTMEYAGQVWPLPQTTQMHLEWELMNRPEENGFFSMCSSYRNEPNPIPGRHNLCFPLLDFETKGDMQTLIQLESELLEHLGYKGPFPQIDYDDALRRYGLDPSKGDELEHEHEERLCEELGPVVFLKNFPKHTSPFWNMALHPGGEHAYKVDVILSGQETFGSAQRSSNVKEMRDMFHTISDGEYANILYKEFSKERVENELEEFLALPFIPRCGGGIGITRLIRSMKKEGLMD